MSANEIQHGGNHYKQFKDFEPWDVITAWGLGYLDGTALKYIARWKHKNGIEDLKKAIHFLQKTIETEEAKQASTQNEPPRLPDSWPYTSVFDYAQRMGGSTGEAPVGPGYITTSFGLLDHLHLGRPNDN